MYVFLFKKTIRSFPLFAHFFSKNEWFAQKTYERIPSPGVSFLSAVTSWRLSFLSAVTSWRLISLRCHLLASHFSPLSPLGVSFLSVVTSWRLISLRCHLLASRFTNPLNADTHLSYSPTCTLTTDSQVNKSYLDSTHNTMFSHTKKIFESFSTTFPLFLLSPLSSFLKIFPFFPPFHLSPSFLSSFSSFPILSSFLFIFPPLSDPLFIFPIPSCSALTFSSFPLLTFLSFSL